MRRATTARCWRWGAGATRAVAMGIALMAVGRAAQPEAAATEHVISLPPLLVEERGLALNWRHAAWPGFELLSVCSDATTEKFVQRHRRMEEMMRLLLPERFCAELAVPDAFVLFNEETGKARSREIVAEIVQKEGATVAPDGTVVLPPAAPRSGTLGRAEQRIRFLPNIRLTDIDVVRVFAILRETDGPMDFVFTKERIEFLLVKRAPALPDWFVAGMLGVYERIKFRDDEIEFQPVVWLSADESAALARDPDRPRLLLPMAELFARQRPAPGGEPTEIERTWRAQSALFVRWALADRSGVRREALWRLVDRLEKEPAGEALFRECFGIGYSDARDRLSDYLPGAAGNSAKLPAPERGRAPRLKLRTPTDLEVARIRGDWERLQIAFVRRKYPALVDRYIEQARRTLRRPYDRGERDPQLLALLGLTECDAGNRDGAREFLEGAAAGKVVRPRVYLELALARWQAIQDTAGVRKLTDEEARRVLGPLLIARGDAPPLAELYALMANVWMASERRPAAEDLAMLEEGARLFPGAASVVMRAIHLHVVAGAYRPAAAMADVGLRHAREPAMRARFERVRADLAPVTK